MSNFYYYFVKPLDINRPNTTIEVEFENMDRSAL